MIFTLRKSLGFCGFVELIHRWVDEVTVGEEALTAIHDIVLEPLNKFSLFK